MEEVKKRKKSNGVPFVSIDPRRNIAGRPKGSRNKLGEDFLKALHEDFNANGIRAIQDCRTDDPTQYVRVIASLLPKELTLNVREVEDLTDEQLISRLAELQTTVRGLLGGNVGDHDAAGAPEIGEDVRGLRPN